MELYDFVFPVVIVILSYAVNEPSVKSRPDFGIFNDFIELKSEEQLKAERHRKRRHFRSHNSLLNQPDTVNVFLEHHASV
jgi:hypothetical protein